MSFVYQLKKCIIFESQRRFSLDELPEFKKFKDKPYYMDFNVIVNYEPNQIRLHSIEVPLDMLGRGIGTKFMNELIDYADRVEKVITLTPSKYLGASSIKRLKDFYKRFGFIENKGKNKNSNIFDKMYRNPKI